MALTATLSLVALLCSSGASIVMVMITDGQQQQHAHPLGSRGGSNNSCTPPQADQP